MLAAAATVVAAAVCPGALARGRPIASLSASPARVALNGSEGAAVALRNFGSSPLTVAASLGELVVDLRGRPALRRRAGGKRSAARWLTVRPRDVVVRPGATAVVEVAARLPSRASPGDHHAAVLFTTRAPRRDAVAVRMRLAVRVVVRAPGRVVRRLLVQGVRVRRVARARVLDVRLANRGNVTETIPRGRLVVTLVARGREVARLRAGPRELLPGGGAIVAVRYAGMARGVVVARVSLEGARMRAFRVRL